MDFEQLMSDVSLQLCNYFSPESVKPSCNGGGVKQENLVYQKSC